jgi:hypothetical protein
MVWPKAGGVVFQNIDWSLVLMSDEDGVRNIEVIDRILQCDQSCKGRYLCCCLMASGVISKRDYACVFFFDEFIDRSQ